MKKAASISAFIVLALQSGGALQGAGGTHEPTPRAESADLTATQQPAYCERIVRNDITAAVLRQDDPRLFDDPHLLLQGGTGMSVADF